MTVTFLMRDVFLFNGITVTYPFINVDVSMTGIITQVGESSC